MEKERTDFSSKGRYLWNMQEYVLENKLLVSFSLIYTVYPKALLHFLNGEKRTLKANPLCETTLMMSLIRVDLIAWDLQSTKFCGEVNTLDGSNTMQRDLERLDRWIYGKLMKFNKAKCKVLHLNQGNPNRKKRLVSEWIKSRSGEKNLRVLVNEKLNMTQQFVVAAQKNNCILGFVRRSLTSSLAEVILLVYSALVRPHLDGPDWKCVQETTLVQGCTSLGRSFPSSLSLELVSL
ncbi:uncharacterized protein LOC126640148 [Myiozetetes cayanensis]|uniref:uncharacterized protein LOC126640148 n=1 Tax=Myiozetetes cayanensis TaxID=478635 RepID=UPI0021609642|nr:uncharacterized protein LOC126640148 [Myiozetetes cayanensis]